MERIKKPLTFDGIVAAEARECYLCGKVGDRLYTRQQDRLFSAPGIWDIRICRNCELAWLDPRPSPEAIPNLYLGYHTHTINPGFPILGKIRRIVGEVVLATHLGYKLRSHRWTYLALGMLASALPMVRESVGLQVMELRAEWRGRLIDVGCGNGTFLARMRDLGWDVLGVEPDSEAVRVAKETFGLTVLEGTLLEAGLPEASADAITLHHVIEHVPDPLEVLAGCYRVLRPGGILVAVTPNVKSLGRYIFGASWRGWEIPRHLFIFSPDTLRICTERVGLKVLSIRTTARAARWIWQESRLIRSFGLRPAEIRSPLKWLLRLEGLAFQIFEWVLTAIENFGEEIVVIATK